MIDATGNEDLGRDDLVSQLLGLLAARDAELATHAEKLAERDAQLTAVEAERDRLRRAYEQLKQELLLVKRRLFIAKAERVDTTQLELEFQDLSRKLDALCGSVPEEEGAGEAGAGDDGDHSDDKVQRRSKKRGRGRSNLAEVDLPEELLELPDDVFEELVAKGKAERIGFETSYRRAYRRGGPVRLAVRRVKYRVIGSDGGAIIATTPRAPELLRRCMAAPSMLAHIATQKFCDGLPLYRLEQIAAREGAPVDRGSMSRWMEELGATFGATVVTAMRKDALDNAFCIATDATGFAIQPGAREGPRRPCRKGHYFVQIADHDHILFEFKAKHTSKAVQAMFRGFEGYVQADAASVYDALFRPSQSDDEEHADGKERREVACWSHARRKYWEAAFAQEPLAREALLRLAKVFEADRKVRGKRRPPSKVAALRKTHVRPLVEDFLAFAQKRFAEVEGRRGPLRSALGYTTRQADALRAFLDDGRLRMDNNLSEGQLRKVVRIRDAALFAGSYEHAEAAGHILSLIASALLHHLDPERYLSELIRVLPHWPRERFLELAPKHWTATRERLHKTQLVAELGPLTVPSPNAAK